MTELAHKDTKKNQPSIVGYKIGSFLKFNYYQSCLLRVNTNYSEKII